MQSHDRRGNVIDTKQVDGDLGKLIEEAMQDKRVTHVTIGKLPEKGEKVEVNGLHYKVMFVDQTHGIVKIKLQKHSK